MATFQKKFLNKTYKVALTSMMAALSLIMLYFGVLFQTGRLAFYFLSAIFVMPMLIEKQPAMAALHYVVVTGLGLLIVPDLTMMLPYALLFGHYAIGKFYIEKMRDKTVAYIVKLLYFDICMAVIYLVAKDILLTGFLENMPIWLLVILVQVAFVVFDFLFSKVTRFYVDNIRQKLVRVSD